MPRSGPSPADAAVIAKVRDYGHQLSYAQLERARRDGIIERNPRRGRGRGVGSTSRSPEGVAEAAAVAG